MDTNVVEQGIVTSIQRNSQDLKTGILVQLLSGGMRAYEVAATVEFECPITLRTKIETDPFSASDCRRCPANPKATLSFRQLSEIGMSGSEVPYCPAINEEVNP